MLQGGGGGFEFCDARLSAGSLAEVRRREGLACSWTASHQRQFRWQSMPCNTASVLSMSSSVVMLFFGETFPLHISRTKPIFQVFLTAVSWMSDKPCRTLFPPFIHHCTHCHRTQTNGGKRSVGSRSGVRTCCCTSRSRSGATTASHWASKTCLITWGKLCSTNRRRRCRLTSLFLDSKL